MSKAVKSPTNTGDKGKPPGLSRGGSPGKGAVPSPTVQGSKGIPPMGGAGSHKAPRD